MPTRNTNIRNHVARSPLLRKGGAHTKSKTGQRVRERLSTSSAIEDWREELEEEKQNQEIKDGEQMLPVDFMLLKHLNNYSTGLNYISIPRGCSLS